MVTFNITGFLTEFAGGRRQISLESTPQTVGEALEELWQLHLGLRDRVLNEQGELRRHVNIFLDNENIRRKEMLSTPLASNSEITILPSVTGGFETIRNQFFQAIRNGDYLKVDNLLTNEPSLIASREEKGTALHFAAIENQREIVDLLLARGADLNARDDEFNMTPIRWANEKGHVEMVEYLFAKGAEVDLYSAVALGLIDRVQDCLSADQSQINEMNHYGAPIHEASLWGHTEIAKLLLENGANPQLRNVHGKTALEIAQTQVESKCRATPIVIEQRRRQIEAGCREVIRLLQGTT